MTKTALKYHNLHYSVDRRMNGRLKHRFRIERKYFDLMCSDNHWQQEEIWPERPGRTIAICNPRTYKFIIIECLVGLYNPTLQLFTSGVTFEACVKKTKLDSRIEPWCNCCVDTPKIDLRQQKK